MTDRDIAGKKVALAVLAVLLVAGGAFAATTTIPYSGGPHMQTNSGLDVQLAGSGELPSGNVFPDDNTFDTGTGTVSATGQASVRVVGLGGTYAEVDNIDASSNPVTIDPDDKQAVSVSGDIDNIRFRDIDVTDSADGETDFEYGGASGTSTITLTDLPADTAVRAVEVGGSVLATGETDSQGDITFVLPNSQHDVDVQAFSTGEPVIEDVSPTVGASDTPFDISATVDDPDFTSDQVTVTIELDGTQVKQTTISSRSTVTTTVNSITGGMHNYTVIAEDKFGNTATKTQAFGVPDTLYLYNETSPTQKVTSADVTIRYFGVEGEDDRVYERSTSNGEIDMRGLPVGQRFVITIDADGYYYRTAAVDSLFNQQNVYLLAENHTAATIQFELDDSTGRFPPGESVLYVDRAINGTDGVLDFETVAGDTFGASNSYRVQLEDDTRYRLRVRNDENETRVMGSYTTNGDALEVLPLGRVTLQSDVQASPVFQATLETDDASGQRYVRVVYVDPTETTSNLTLTVYEQGNETNVLRPESTETGPFGTYVETIPLPANASDDVSYRVEYSTDRFGGNEDDSGDRLVGDVPEIAKTFGLAPGVLEILAWVGMLMITGLVVIVDSRAAAIVAVVLSTALTWAGALSIPPFLLLLASVAALVFFIGGGR